MNVWSMNDSGGDLKQHTHQKSFDVREAALSGQKMVYRAGADLYLLDLKDRTDRKLDIDLVSDFEQLREKWVTDPQEYITSVAVSNEGEKVAFTARGRVFVLPTKEGRIVRLDRKDGVRFREAVFTPDDREVLLLSD